MKPIKYHNQTEKEALEYTSKIVDMGVTLLVYAALNELLNAHNLLRRSKHFKNTVKKRANEALRMRNRKVVELKSLVLYKGFAESYWDAVIDACEEDVKKLRSEIKLTLDDAEIEDSDLYSQAETARVMLEAAKIHYEEVIRDVNAKFRAQNLEEMKKLNLFDVFHEFYIDGIFKEWNIVCSELYSNKHRDVELNNERTMEAFISMADKFAKGQYIESCLEAASVEYPEFADVKIKITK